MLDKGTVKSLYDQYQLLGIFVSFVPYMDRFVNGQKQTC